MIEDNIEILILEKEGLLEELDSLIKSLEDNTDYLIEIEDNTFEVKDSLIKRELADGIVSILNEESSFFELEVFGYVEDYERKIKIIINDLEE